VSGVGTRPQRIVVVGKFHPDGFANHILDGFTDLGHSALAYEWGTSHAFTATSSRLRYRVSQMRTVIGSQLDALPSRRARAGARLGEVARAHGADLVVVTHDYLLPAQVAEVKRRSGAAVAMWFPDHIGGFGRAAFLNGAYDGLFFKDPFIVDVLRRDLDRPVHYLPEACNPRVHTPDGIAPAELEPYRCDITTAGNAHASRVAALEALVGFDVRVWGPQAPLWLDRSRIPGMLQERFVANREKAVAFLAAKIVINHLYPAEVWGLNARTFETAGIGAFQLVGRRPGLGQLFVDGEELVSFGNRDELLGLVRRYLADDAERLAVAARARARALREHTYGHRLALMLDTVGGAADGFPMPCVQCVIGERTA